MLHLTHHDIENMDSRYRAQLINSLSGFKSTNLIGTQSTHGDTNLAMFSSVVHLGSSPALIGFVMRPHKTERHTLENIQQTHQYTINHVNTAIFQAAHQTSARYKKYECEFNKTGLTPEFLPNINPPFVKESRIKYAVTLQEIIPITHNDTLFIIGEVIDIYCDDQAIQLDGYIDIESLQTVCTSGLDSYHATHHLARLSYAKPNSLPKVIA